MQTQFLRHAAALTALLSQGRFKHPHQDALRYAADTLTRLERLRQRFEQTDPEDEVASDALAVEVVALLGLRRS